MTGTLSVVKKMMHAAVLFCLLSPALYAHGDEKTQKPTTIPAIWQAVDKELSDINDAITNNQLGEIHHHAFAINELMNSLLPLSQSLSQVQLTTVKKQMGYIDELAKRLDKTGDANDKEGSLANFAKMQKIIAQIRVPYSAELKQNQ